MPYTGPSIVDYLNSYGQPSDMKSRAKLAAQSGIQNYTGTSAQNTQLLNTLRGQTSAPATTTPTPMTPLAAPTVPAPAQGASQGALSASAPASTGNQLLDLKNALDLATNLGRQKRNALSLNFMQPFQGTVAASDFNSILSGLNSASDTFSTDLQENAMEAYDAGQPKYDIIKDAEGNSYQVQIDASGKVIGRPTPIFGGGGNSNSTSNSSLPPYDQWVRPYLQTPDGQALTRRVGGDNVKLSQEARKIYSSLSNTVSLGKLAPEDKRVLSQSGLIDAPVAVQSFFLNAPLEFRQEWSRNVATGDLDINDVTLEEVKQVYEEWKKTKNDPDDTPY